MPYPAGHREAVKKNIINSARKLFNRHGFESVSLQQIMAGAGYIMVQDMQMMFRDARVGMIGGGTSEIQRNVIARCMGL